MNTIPVVWLTNRLECWDQALVNDTLSASGWSAGYDFDHRVGLDALTGREGAVLVIPGAAEQRNIARINRAIARLSWVLAIVTSDERRCFPLHKLNHPNMHVWLQYPGHDDEADWHLPVGYPPHYRQHLADLPYEKPNGWFWSGQANHPRRKELATALRGLGDGSYVETPGFTQGLSHATYATKMARAKFAPCPSGPESVDSFRVAEALEAGCIPILDASTPAANASWLWGLAYPGLDVPIVADWSRLPAVLGRLTTGWPANANRVSAWWQSYERQLAERIGSTIGNLSTVEREHDAVTVLIPTSPIATHPDTAIIDQTIASVRHWLPDAEILVLCDGVRPEQESYRARYEDYLARLVWSCARTERILPIVHDEHLHQAEMTRRALDLVHTPAILFVEHDTPLVTDEHIDFPAVLAAVNSTEVDLVRFHYEGRIHSEHEHLMLDRARCDIRSVPMIRTTQWSQRPHIASTAFYRRLLREHFPQDYRGMIEDRLHSVVHTAWREYGKAGWDRYRLAVYAPYGLHIKRSDHLDGRGSDPKWTEG